ncbi:MAG: hypothetical protein IJT68_09885 [Lentisphaeria bacterium]|nr:hypothetical protein [Lentisphaeria bacterium]
MFKHITIIAAAMLVSLTAFAGKPYSVLVFDDLSRPVSSDQQDNRTTSLLIEYLKSELVTHSQIALCNAETVEKTMKEFRIKHKLGTNLTEAEIKDILAGSKGDYLALLAIIPEKDAKNVRVTVYDKTGKKYDPLTVPISSIRESELPAVVLATSIARLIRGESDVDRLSFEREKQIIAESAEDRAREAAENKEKSEARAREIQLREEAAKKQYEDITKKDGAK